MRAILADRPPPRNLTSAPGSGTGLQCCSLIVRSRTPTQLFHLAAPLFRGNPLFARAGLWFGRASFFRTPCGVLQKRAQPRPRRLPVLCLRSMLAAVDEQHIVGDHAAAGEASKAFLHLIGQRRGADIEAQLHRRRDFVDVLAAGARGANEALLYVLLVQHDRSMLTSPPSTPVRSVRLAGPGGSHEESLRGGFHCSNRISLRNG